MNSLLEQLYLKRFCIPVKEHENKSPCDTKFNHISCILKEKDPSLRYISYGINSPNLSSFLPSIHAEISAIQHLPPSKKKHRFCKPEYVDLFVVRLSIKNKLQSSRPCIDCIRKMKTEPNKKGYQIRHIYYSDTNGEIIKTTLDKLEKEEPHYSRYYLRTMHLVQ
jgi:hypothetical protein